MKPDTERHEYKPDSAVPPGETLLEILCERLEKETGINITTIERLIRGETQLTEDIANKLEKTTKVPARLWLALENDYRDHLNRRLEEADAPFICDYYTDVENRIRKWICHRGPARNNAEEQCQPETPPSTTTENTSATTSAPPAHTSPAPAATKSPTTTRKGTTGAGAL